MEKYRRTDWISDSVLNTFDMLLQHLEEFFCFLFILASECCQLHIDLICQIIGIDGEPYIRHPIL